jgi:capsular polysaccharide biosynthesis protein
VLEELSIPEQVALFSNAEIVVGPHGAGFTNLLFAEDTDVVSLYGEVRAPMYYIISSILGFNYGYLTCDAPQNNLVVDVEDLRTLFEKIGFEK